ncbi:MAG: TonB-dependent receptor plug domain-containing protein [Bacteroidia bacterium]|nr:TonB-dependent receptor plug domain-containing protein [Bacteroidia bacterium]
MKRILILFIALTASVSALAQMTIKDRMGQISEQYGVNFVYDPALPVNAAYRGAEVKKASLDESLDLLFKGSGISWERRRKFVVLKAEAPTDKPATPQPLSYEAEIQLDSITAATVTGKIDRNLNFTQTGLTKIDGAALNRGFAVLSSPDVLKTLQILPGVSSGTEMLSSLYVHGGDGTDNLYLMDGVPLYQICHLGGVFSAFNTDFIDNLDFYKSGFPARYGGRTSSVVDIHGKDGSFTDYSGSWSLGLLEGRFQLDGPIVKGKTSFNIALRRSWADLLLYPACAMINAGNAKSYTDNYMDKSTYGYSFTDLNSRVTHLFSETSRLTANVYLGNDQFLMKTLYSETFTDRLSGFSDETNRASLTWGNVLASLNWQKEFSPELEMMLCGYWSGTRSSISYDSVFDTDYVVIENDDREKWYYNTVLDTQGILDDTGVTADFNWRPSLSHQLRFGGNAIVHSYRPTYGYRENEVDMDVTVTDLTLRDTVRTTGLEFSVYAEDEMKITDWLKANVGLRNTVYSVPGRVWNSLEPRLALKVQLAPNMSLKASYSEMSQFSHQLATTYLDLPTNCWMPSGEKVAPMRSRQVAGGIYSKFPHDLHLNVEGWYKTMDNLVEYSGMNTFFPQLRDWEDQFNIGRGRSYGMEVDGGYETSRLSLNAFYTLSWNMRYFERIWPEWYRDRNDNRHKLTLMANWRPNRKYELFAAWNFHSGNRVTAATQYVQGVYDSSETTGADQDGILQYRFIPQFVYEAPNNIKLPDYHRLDIGVNIHKTTKRGNESVWNVSIYNVYCRINPLYAYVYRDGFRDWDPEYKPEDVHFKGKGVGIIPIIPTFSYTCKF